MYYYTPSKDEFPSIIKSAVHCLVIDHRVITFVSILIFIIIIEAMDMYTVLTIV